MCSEIRALTSTAGDRVGVQRQVGPCCSVLAIGTSTVSFVLQVLADVDVGEVGEGPRPELGPEVLVAGGQMGNVAGDA
jgi:hypothetical protein